MSAEIETRKVVRVVEPVRALEGAGRRLKWMTAGGGIIHKEMPRPREGMRAGVRLWEG